MREQVTSWQGAKLAHERFVTDYNVQPHWAHRKRDDHRLSPAEVLSQETGKLRTPEQLHRIFYAMRYLKRLDRLGYAHFRRWKLYGEEALARHPAVIWLHGDALTVEYQETPLAQYRVRYQPDKKHFKAVPEARRFETPYRSLQGHRMASWMRPCGSEPFVSPTTLLEENARERPSRYSYS
jgi:hypothetical protein